MPDPLSFGHWLKKLRADLDLTQEALAEAVGYAPQTVRAIESGARRPSRELAERLANELQVPPERRADFVRLARTAATGKEQMRPPLDRTGAPAPSAAARGGQGATNYPAPPQPPPLLTTKLYLPRPRANLVSRPRLLARLDASLARPLTVISAPAGFGKTTLLAEWLAASSEERGLSAEGVPPPLDPRSTTRSSAAAWLALDAEDSDPLLFLRYLIAALQTIVPAIGGSVLPLLGTAQAPPIQSLMPLLINDLVRVPGTSILVLDDYHVVDAPAIHQALTFLVEHLPPQLHLVIASRADPPLPLARWRGRGLLAELRAHDLRFTPEEAAAFLQDVMDLPLTAEAVAALEARTEGWIAGLQLVGLSLRDRPAEQLLPFIDAFTGSHRFVVDYLVDEVLARQPPHLQTFLLQTSILERLSGRLCDAVVLGDVSDTQDARRNMEHGYSQLLLADLERRNLFIVPLDEAQHWYRYHHLFARVMRERLSSGANPDAIATLHRRASGWFEGHGLVVEAVQHALAAQDWGHASHLIEQHGLLLMLRGRGQTVLDWLNRLPETLSGYRPYLSILRGAALIFVNQMNEAEGYLQAAERAVSADAQDEESRTIRGYATIFRAHIARYRGDMERCVAQSEQALALLPDAQASPRTSARINVASSFLVSGDVTPARERLLVDAIAPARASGDLTALLRGLTTLASLQQWQGRLRQSAVTYREAAQMAPEPDGLATLVHGAAYHFGLGNLLHEWNDLDAAEHHLLQGRAMVRQGVLTDARAITLGYVGLARLQQARGDSRSAGATLTELADLAQQRNFAAEMLRRVAAAQAHLALLQCDLEAALHWVDYSGVRPNDDLSYPREVEYLTLARVRIAEGRSEPASPHLADVLRLLDRLLQVAETGGRMNSMIEILILRALALHTQNDLDHARGALERALTFAAPEGYVRSFVDEGAPMAVLLADMLGVGGWGVGAGAQGHGLRAYSQKILAAFHAEGIDLAAGSYLAPATPLPVVPINEPLTGRELEVLRLLTAGRSNEAIARELVVAVGTVKRHVSNIIGKLQAGSRLDAVARARHLGLV